MIRPTFLFLLDAEMQIAFLGVAATVASKRTTVSSSSAATVYSSGEIKMQDEKSPRNIPPPGPDPTKGLPKYSSLVQTAQNNDDEQDSPEENGEDDDSVTSGGDMNAIRSGNYDDNMDAEYDAKQYDNLDADMSYLDSENDAKDPDVSHIDTSDVWNVPQDRFNKDCLPTCDKQSGFCPTHCGHDGYCCRINFMGGGCTGKVGSPFYHQCVRIPEVHKKKLDHAVKLIEEYKGLGVKNVGKDCKPHCSDKSGPCDSFCGKGNLCCKKGKVENGCNGFMGIDIDDGKLSIPPSAKKGFAIPPTEYSCSPPSSTPFDGQKKLPIVADKTLRIRHDVFSDIPGMTWINELHKPFQEICPLGEGLVTLSGVYEQSSSVDTRWKLKCGKIKKESFYGVITKDEQKSYTEKDFDLLRKGLVKECAWGHWSPLQQAWEIGSSSYHEEGLGNTGPRYLHRFVAGMQATADSDRWHLRGDRKYRLYMCSWQDCVTHRYDPSTVNTLSTDGDQSIVLQETKWLNNIIASNTMSGRRIFVFQGGYYHITCKTTTTTRTPLTDCPLKSNAGNWDDECYTPDAWEAKKKGEIAKIKKYLKKKKTKESFADSFLQLHTNAFDVHELDTNDGTDSYSDVDSYSDSDSDSGGDSDSDSDGDVADAERLDSDSTEDLTELDSETDAKADSDAEIDSEAEPDADDGDDSKDADDGAHEGKCFNIRRKKYDTSKYTPTDETDGKFLTSKSSSSKKKNSKDTDPGVDSSDDKKKDSLVETGDKSIYLRGNLVETRPKANYPIRRRGESAASSVTNLVDSSKNKNKPIKRSKSVTRNKSMRTLKSGKRQSTKRSKPPCQMVSPEKIFEKKSCKCPASSQEDKKSEKKNENKDSNMYNNENKDNNMMLYAGIGGGVLLLFSCSIGAYLFLAKNDDYAGDKVYFDY